jgi:outer membrane biosynthesis protein TonB
VPAHRSIVKYTGKKEEPKKEEPKKEPKAKKEPKPKAEREPKPKTEKAPRQETGYGGGKTMSRGEERAARLKDTQALDKQKLENAKNKEKRFAQREKDRKKASRSAALGGLLNRIRSKDSADNQVTPGSVYKGSTMTYGGSK